MGPSRAPPADEDASRYIPTREELETLFERLGAPTIRLIDQEPGEWDAAATYETVATYDAIGLVERFQFTIAASVHSSVADARAFFSDWTDILESSNERTTALDQSLLAATYGVDEVRGYRLIYTDPRQGERLSDYATLLRLGRATALVEGIGPPPEDPDEPGHHQGRDLMVGWTTWLVLGKMVWAPPDQPARWIANVEPYAGLWTRHGFGIQVFPDGRAEGSWRTYTWCSDEPTAPCDQIVGNAIIDGGHAQIVFGNVDNQRLWGLVLATSDSRLVPVGPITLARRPDGMGALEPMERDAIEVCGPDMPALAPTELRESQPCGA